MNDDSPYRMMSAIDVDDLKDREDNPWRDNVAMGAGALLRNRNIMKPTNPETITTGTNNIQLGMPAAKSLGHVFQVGSDNCIVCGVRIDASIEELREKEHDDEASGQQHR